MSPIRRHSLLSQPSQSDLSDSGTIDLLQERIKDTGCRIFREEQRHRDIRQCFSFQSERIPTHIRKDSLLIHPRPNTAPKIIDYRNIEGCSVLNIENFATLKASVF